MPFNVPYLKTVTGQGVAAQGSYLSAAKLPGATIPPSAVPMAAATFRHTGTAGFWYVMFIGSGALSATNYSIKLGPGEPFTEDNPPIGDVWVLADGSVDAGLSWSVGYKQ